MGKTVKNIRKIRIFRANRSFLRTICSNPANHSFLNERFWAIEQKANERKSKFPTLLLGGLDAVQKWMIIRFTPYQTTTLPKWMLSQKRLFKSSLLLNGNCGIQVRPPITNEDLCLLFCFYPSSMFGADLAWIRFGMVWPQFWFLLARGRV